MVALLVGVTLQQDDDQELVKYWADMTENLGQLTVQLYGGDIGRQNDDCLGASMLGLKGKVVKIFGIVDGRELLQYVVSSTTCWGGAKGCYFKDIGCIFK